MFETEKEIRFSKKKKKRFSLAQTLFPLGFPHMQQCCLVYSVPHMENKLRNQVESFIN